MVQSWFQKMLSYSWFLDVIIFHRSRTSMFCLTDIRLSTAAVPFNTSFFQRKVILQRTQYLRQFLERSEYNLKSIQSTILSVTPVPQKCWLPLNLVPFDFFNQGFDNGVRFFLWRTACTCVSSGRICYLSHRSYSRLVKSLQRSAACDGGNSIQTTW